MEDSRSRRRPQYLNRDVFVRADDVAATAVDAAAASSSSSSLTMLSPSLSTTADPDTEKTLRRHGPVAPSMPATTASSRAVARLQTLNGHISGTRNNDNKNSTPSSPSSPSPPSPSPSSPSPPSPSSRPRAEEGDNLVKISESSDGFVLYHWFRSSSSSSGSSSSSSSSNESGERAQRQQQQQQQQQRQRGSALLPIGEIEALVEEAWEHDYRRSDQARFRYGRRFLEWYSQGDCCDFVLAREARGTRGLVAVIAVSKRLLYLASERSSSPSSSSPPPPPPLHPILYVTLMTVSPAHRKFGLGAALFGALVDRLVPFYSGGGGGGGVRAAPYYMGAFDGAEKSAGFEAGVFDRRESALAMHKEDKEQQQQQKEATASSSLSAAAAAAAAAASMAGGGGARRRDDDERGRRRRRRPRRRQAIISRTRQIPFWACTRDLRELLRYMPLSSELLTSVALTGVSRRLLEFSFRGERGGASASSASSAAAAAGSDDNEEDYRVSLVEPRGVSYPVRGAPETSGFVLNETLATLYGKNHPDVAGTYRVDFPATGHSAEFSFVRHVVVKRGLVEAGGPRTCVQIQIVDRGDTTRGELRRALQVVCNEFFEWGERESSSEGGGGGGSGSEGGGGGGSPHHRPSSSCIAVLLQNWIGIPTVDLLRARFLPSDRKIGFLTARDAALGAAKYGDSLLFDVV